MPEKLLYGPDVGAVIHHVRCERVPKHVRNDAPEAGAMRGQSENVANARARQSVRLDASVFRIRLWDAFPKPFPRLEPAHCCWPE